MAAQDGLTEPELSQTLAEDTEKVKGKGGRTRRAPDVGIWAVRGVDLETRAIIGVFLPTGRIYTASNGFYS